VQQREAARARGLSRRTIIFIVTNVISVASLYWVLSHSQWREFGTDIRELNWWWIALAVVADILVYVCHGWRWSLLLTPIERIPVFRSVQAVYVGLFANEILPFRTGELIRCYLQSQWSTIPFSVTISSAVIERFFDGLWLGLLLLFVIGRTPNMPEEIKVGGWLLLGVLLIGAAVLAVGFFHKERAHAVLGEKGWQRHLRVLIQDLHLIGHSRYPYFSALATIPYLLLQVVPIYASMRAFGFTPVTWGDATVLMVCLRLSSAVPQAPGNVGTFQLFTRQLLKVLGYPAADSGRFSFLLWLVVTLPLMVIGFIALLMTETKIGELHRRAKAEIPVSK
jgi:uncharacterized membrane protein YbhN (UPF0104 family)